MQSEWNVGILAIKAEVKHYNYKKLLQTHYSIIPLFHYSIIPLFHYLGRSPQVLFTVCNLNPLQSGMNEYEKKFITGQVLESLVFLSTFLVVPIFINIPMYTIFNNREVPP